MLRHLGIDPLPRKVRARLAVKIVDFGAQACAFHWRVLPIPAANHTIETARARRCRVSNHVAAGKQDERAAVAVADSAAVAVTVAFTSAATAVEATAASAAATAAAAAAAAAAATAARR